MIVILIGPAGAGKTSVGHALAEALGWTFVDADTLHPASNVEKIRAGTPLTDADRGPWLARVRDTILDFVARDVDAVLACSALRARYRRRLGEGVPELRWVFLDADRELLTARLRARRGHFAGPEIVDSQLRELEPPTDALTLDAALPLPALVQHICHAFGLPRTD
jgi:gluconokinase